jgi:hypothetical protein
MSPSRKRSFYPAYKGKVEADDMSEAYVKQGRTRLNIEDRSFYREGPSSHSPLS